MPPETRAARTPGHVSPYPPMSGPGSQNREYKSPFSQVPITESEKRSFARAKALSDAYVPDSSDSSSSTEPATEAASPKEARLDEPELFAVSSIENSADPTSASNKQVVDLTTPEQRAPMATMLPDPELERETTEPNTIMTEPTREPARAHLPGEGLHDKWFWIATPTSKCDVCHKNKRGLLYQCRHCTRNVCVECQKAGNVGDKCGVTHILRPESMSIPPKPANVKTPVKRQPKKQATRGGRVTKTTARENVVMPKGSYTHQAKTNHYVPTTSQKGVEWQPPIVKHGTHCHAVEDAQALAASALTAMQSGSFSENGTASTGLVPQQAFPVHPSTEPHDQASMPPHHPQPDLRPRSSHNVRFEPYDVGKRHRDMGYDLRGHVRQPSQIPPEQRPPLPPLDAWSIAEENHKKAQSERRNGSDRSENASSGRAAQETSVSLETVDENPKREAPFSTPLSREAPRGVPAPNPIRHATLPSIGPIMQSVPPAPVRSGSSNQVVSPSGNQSRYQGHGQGHPIQDKYQPSHVDWREDMSEYVRPMTAATIPGPPISPWTRQAFPVPRTNGEAYGLWQLFKVHEVDMQNHNVDIDKCLALRTEDLWDHLRNAPQLPYEEKWRLLRYASWFALRHLNIDMRNSRTIRWLLNLESSLVDRGHFLERSFLDAYRAGRVQANAE